MFSLAVQEDKNISKIFKTLVEHMNEASAQGRKKSSNKTQAADDNRKGFGSDDGDKPDTKEESKGGGCKCAIQ